MTAHSQVRNIKKQIFIDVLFHTHPSKRNQPIWNCNNRNRNGLNSRNFQEIVEIERKKMEEKETTLPQYKLKNYCNENHSDKMKHVSKQEKKTKLTLKIHTQTRMKHTRNTTSKFWFHAKRSSSHLKIHTHLQINYSVLHSSKKNHGCV